MGGGAVSYERGTPLQGMLEIQDTHLSEGAQCA